MKIVVILLLTLIVGISCAKHSPRGKSGKSKSLNSTVTSRIIKGEHAFSGEFPHQVLLRFKRKSGTKFPLCGGSLIRENWILTTAYCTKNAKEVTIEMGSVVVDKMPIKFKLKESHHGQKVFFTHPKYDDFLANNVGLIRLPHSPLESHSHEHSHSDSEEGPDVRTIRLSYADKSYNNTSLRTSGYGRTANGKNAKNLQAMEIRGISNDECETYLGSLISDISPQILCAFGDPTNSRQTCIGDGGGAVITRGPTPMQVAIISFGSSDCTSEIPMGFVRVSAFRDWIENTISVNS